MDNEMNSIREKNENFLYPIDEKLEKKDSDSQSKFLEYF
jgi:hypothetical protein